MLWFKHDADASTDAKIKKLLIRYGATGYAIYFHCIELIVSDISETNITFELEHDAEIIADNLKIKGTADKAGVEIVNEIMRYIVNLGLFEERGGHITCYKILKRLDSSMTSNARLRQMIQVAKTKTVEIELSCERHDEVMINHDNVMQEEKRREEKRNILPEKSEDFVKKNVNEVQESNKSSTNVQQENTIIKTKDIVTNKEDITASPTTALAVVNDPNLPSKAVKKSTLTPEQLSLYHDIEKWFKAVPTSEAVMYKDSAAASRTGKAIKTIVVRCFSHAKGGGDPVVVARAMMEAFYKATRYKGKGYYRGAFTPTQLVTEWVWDALYQECANRAQAVDEGSISTMLEQLRIEKKRVKEAVGETN